MKKILTALTAATIISATPLAMSDTANAQWGRHGFYRGFGYRGVGYGGYRGVGYGGYGGVGYGGYGGVGYGGYGGVGYGGYGGAGYGGYGGVGYGGCGGCGAAIVAAPVVYVPVVVYSGYHGCGC